MKYPDLRPAIDAYREGRNVMAVLRELHGVNENTDDIVEIAYDLQAGTYARYVEDYPAIWQPYCQQFNDVLRTYVRPGDRVLDVGTGEMTTLGGVARAGLPADVGLYGCDLSFSRIAEGREFLARNVPEVSVNSFVATLFELPLAASSMDVVWTVHALEPNGGREVSAIAELLRVTARYLVLFEPSYEHNTAEGQRRMEALGYIRNLPESIERCGGRIERSLQMPTATNPLNPTWAYIVRAPAGSGRNTGTSIWACPRTGGPMRHDASCFFSPHSGCAYPIIDDTPILKPDAAVRAFAMATRG
jgi:uncharacterized protein YbaR (Trm112 family)